MEEFKSNIINKEDVEIQTNIRYEHNTRYDEVIMIHNPTRLKSFASSLNGQISAYSNALVMLEDKVSDSLSNVNKEVLKLEINITIETDFNIDDDVFVITQIAKYNNLYRNETIWAVETDDFDRRRHSPFKIKGRIIEQFGRKPIVFYKVYNYLYKETEMFKDLDSAVAECKKRNEA